MEPKRILFLYTEIAGYFLACVNELAKQGADVHIVRWPVNKEAPFNFDPGCNVNLYERKKFDATSLVSLMNNIDPDIIVCSGWIDKEYVKACRNYKGKAVKIVTLDNQWKGTLKQRIATLISRFTLLKIFSHAWVPGILQAEYAHRLGFSKDHTLTGFYSADHTYFHAQYLRNREKKKERFPGRFLYVGRYYAFKGVQDLWEAFAELQQEEPNEWELWCLGTGDLAPYQHPKIKHFGFVQPSEMGRFVSETGVFILPSHFEPWGVVVHEFAASGFPLVCSDEVGARTAFVEENYNGYIYRAGDKEELKKVLRTIMKHSQSDLFEMGERSVEKAKQVTPEKWAATLQSVLNK